MTAILDIISNFRLQQIATGCNFRLQQIAVSGCNSLQFQVAIQACNSLQLQVTTACNRLQHVAISGCNMLQFQVATDCNTLQFQVATDYNRLQFQINFKLQFHVAVQVSVLGCNFRLQFQISDFNFIYLRVICKQYFEIFCSLIAIKHVPRTVNHIYRPYLRVISALFCRIHQIFTDFNQIIRAQKVIPWTASE